MENQKSFYITASQFIEIDVNNLDKPPKWVRACKQEDFNKWCLDVKKIEISPMAYLSANPQIIILLQEFLDMKFCDWRIEPISFNEDEILIKTDNEENVVRLK